MHVLISEMETRSHKLDAFFVLGKYLRYAKASLLLFKGRGASGSSIRRKSKRRIEFHKCAIKQIVVLIIVTEIG